MNTVKDLLVQADLRTLLKTYLYKQAYESGDSSVVTRWTVDQEVVGSNPTHGGNLISVVRSLSGFTQPIR